MHRGTKIDFDNKIMKILKSMHYHIDFMLMSLWLFCHVQFTEKIKLN